MDDADHETMKVWGLTYWGWVLVYFAAMAAGAAAFMLGLGPWWLTLVPLVLVPAMSQAQMKWLGDKGVGSPALSRYNRNCLTTVFAYLACIFAGAQIQNRFDLGRAAALGLAAVSMLSVFAMIWALVRYLTDETDEYLRERAMVSALFGLFTVLAFGSLWGFLEMYGFAPSLWAGWVFPGWAVGLGLGNGWQWMRSR